VFGRGENNGQPKNSFGIFQDGRFPVNWPESGRFVPDSGNFCQNLYMPNLKKYFYIILY